MSKDYESEADRRDQEASQLRGQALNVKNKIDTLSDIADTFKNNPDSSEDSYNKESENNHNQELNENRSINDTSSNNPSSSANISQSKEDANNHSKAPSGEGGKKAGEEAGKGVAKEGTKAGVKEAAKEGAKEGAKAAAASTGAGAVVAAGMEAVDKATKAVKSIGEHTHKTLKEVEDAEGKIDLKARKKRKAENMAEDNSVVKLFIAIFAIIAAIIILVVILLVSVIFTLLAPVTVLFSAIHNGYEKAHDALTALSGKASYEDISYYYQDELKECFHKAFDEVCYNEVLQIIEENEEYDAELTKQSYADNDFPYILEGDDCNVNYLEILSVLSMNDDYNVLNYDYDEFMKVFEDQEFLRSLYDLKVERAEMDIYDEDEYDENGVLIHQGTGALKETKIYGKVTISKYPLKKIFDYAGVDPNASNFNFPSLTNYQALNIIESYTKQQKSDIDWGYKGTSQLYDYKMYTGEITKSEENIYLDEMYDELELGDIAVANGVPVYNQADPIWAMESYGSGNIKQLGCCLTSMSMVTSYFTGQQITPLDMSHYIKDNYGGGLYRYGIARDFGFHQYTTQAPFNCTQAISDLAEGKIFIVHIKPGHLGHSAKYGHYVVLSGCDTTDGNITLTIADPSGGKILSWSAEEAIYNLDYMWAYGR